MHHPRPQPRFVLISITAVVGGVAGTLLARLLAPAVFPVLPVGVVSLSRAFRRGGAKL